ncbi:MAG: hypothetical protein O3B87_05680, partial [bacterium]|nr:hypothetical protein [bacterium]
MNHSILLKKIYSYFFLAFIVVAPFVFGAGDVRAASLKMTNVSFSCSSTDTATATWDADLASVKYSLRLYKQGGPWSGCINVNDDGPGEACLDKYVNSKPKPPQHPTSHTFTIDPNGTYDFWMHSRGLDGSWSDGVRVNGLRCGPTPTPGVPQIWYTEERLGGGVQLASDARVDIYIPNGTCSSNIFNSIQVQNTSGNALGTMKSYSKYQTYTTSDTSQSRQSCWQGSWGTPGTANYMSGAFYRMWGTKGYFCSYSHKRLSDPVKISVPGSGTSSSINLCENLTVATTGTITAGQDIVLSFALPTTPQAGSCSRVATINGINTNYGLLSVPPSGGSVNSPNTDGLMRYTKDGNTAKTTVRFTKSGQYNLQMGCQENGNDTTSIRTSSNWLRVDVQAAPTNTPVPPTRTPTPTPTRTPTPVPLADLAITSLTVSPSSPNVGQGVTISYSARNLSGSTVAGRRIRIYIDPVGNPAMPATTAWKESATGIAWPVGDTQSGSWTHTFTEAKTYQVYAKVDPLNVIAESNENNNLQYLGVVVVAAPTNTPIPPTNTQTPTPTPTQLLRPDLIITSQSVYPNPATQYGNATLTFTVKNDLRPASGTFTVAISGGVRGQQPWSTTISSDGIAGLYSKTFTQELNPQYAGQYTLSIAVDSEQVVDEYDETNNTVFLTFNSIAPAPTNTSVPAPTNAPTNTPVPLPTSTPIPPTPTPVKTNTPI